MKKNKTLEDVAAAAGVSKMTASRALRGDRDVSAANVKKVTQVARAIGYYGNYLAASLSSKRSNLIGVVVPAMSNIVFPQVMSGVSDALSGTGLQPVFGVTDYDTEKEYEIVRNMLSWRPAGLILTGLDQAKDTVKLLETIDIPVVQIMDSDGTPIDRCIGFSHTKAGSEMAQAILSYGRKKIGFVGANIDKDTRAAKRRKGFLSTLAEKGLGYYGERISNGPSSVTTGRNLAKDLINRYPDIDCIYFTNDDLAVGGLGYCLDSGIDVPQRLALVGFNDLELLSAFPGKIATSRTSRQEIGKKAAEMILVSLKNGGAPIAKTTIIQPEIRLGAIVLIAT